MKRIIIAASFLLVSVLPGVSPLIARADTGSDAVFNLERCLAVARENNNDLKEARAQVEEARASYRGKIGLVLPRLDANLSYDRYREQLPSKKQRYGESLDNYYAELVLKLPIFQGGKDWGGIKAAQNALDARKQRLELTRREVDTAVKKAYYDRVESAISLEIQKELLRNLEEQTVIAKLLYDSGKFSAVDVLRVETRAAAAKDTLNNMEMTLRIRSLALGRVLGVNGEVRTPVDVEDIETHFSIRRSCVAEGFDGNPEFREAKYQLERSRYQELMAKSGHYPYFSLRGNYNWEDKEFFPGNPNWNVGAAVTIPIFHGGTVSAATSEAEARTTRLKARLDDISKDLAVRFNSSEATILDSLNRLATTGKVLSLAEESYRTSLVQYKSGKLSSLDLIDVQTVWYNARLSYKKNIIDCYVAIAEIEQICPGAVIENRGGKGKQ